ncbi:hypothetical protein QEN19_002083 [Hanseniaspora menglaensis]
MFAHFFKRPMSSSFSFLKAVNKGSSMRSISMLLANRTGTSSNSLAQKQLLHSSILKNSLMKGTEEYTELSLSPLQSFIQVVSKRFLKVNFKSSQLKKKRKFGFKARLKTNGGRKLIARKKVKGRKYLSH